MLFYIMNINISDKQDIELVNSDQLRLSNITDFDSIQIDNNSPNNVKLVKITQTKVLCHV